MVRIIQRPGKRGRRRRLDVRVGVTNAWQEVPGSIVALGLGKRTLELYPDDAARLATMLVQAASVARHNLARHVDVS
jgi:hypothetical protein